MHLDTFTMPDRDLERLSRWHVRETAARRLSQLAAAGRRIAPALQRALTHLIRVLVWLSEERHTVQTLDRLSPDQLLDIGLHPDDLTAARRLPPGQRTQALAEAQRTRRAREEERWLRAISQYRPGR